MTSTLKILIVDDRPENLLSLRKVLDDMDAEIIEATSGNEALAATIEHDFAVAILDIRMPGMNGYELAEHLRGDDKTKIIPIMFVTASHTDELQVFKGYEAGGIDYIVKPMDPDILRGKVRNFLELARHRQELREHRDHLEEMVEERTARLDHLNAVLRSIRDVNQLIVREKDRKRLLERVCKNLINTRGFRGSWIIVTQGPTNDLLGAQSGFDESNFSSMMDGIRRNDLPSCCLSIHKPEEVAVRSNPGSECKNCPLSSPYEQNAGMTTGLFYDDRHLGWLGVSVPREYVSSPEELSLLTEIAGDISFALQGIKNEEERRQTTKRLDLHTRVLAALNRSNEWKDLIKDILQEVKEFTGFDAVAIRLREGEDYPYFVYNGFTGDFVEQERYLCERNEDGDIVCDANGNPYLECMCGNVIQGRIDPTQPFFTDNGSFWTNSTSQLLAGTTEDDRQSRTRNRCHGEGYESVALIPLHADKDIIGLLQLNDMRTNQLSKELIHFFEEIGNSIGIAFTRKQSQEQLYQYSTQLETMVEERTRSLKEAQERLIRQEKLAALGQLAGSVAHELRNPLGVISNAAYFLNMTTDELDEKTREYLGIIKNEVDGASKIVADLLDLTRVKTPDTVPVELKQLINRILLKQETTDSIETRNLIPDDLPPVDLDPDQMSRVFRNLLSNAIQAMSEKGILDIAARMEDGDLIIEIIDTGPGIDQETRKMIFEPLFSTRPRGIGLGLPICKNIVEAHGGRMEIESEIGKGTVAKIILPMGEHRTSK